MSASDIFNQPGFFRYFYEMEQIPRVSGHTRLISDYFVDFANDHNLRYIQDKSNNVVIFKEGTCGMESAPAVILQGHMDMVGEKTSDSMHDFQKDPLDLFVDGDLIGAKNTTLGGDDIIAAAYALAIVDDDTVPHPPLEVLMTVDEETGMTGALSFDYSSLTGKMLLNIDSEEEGILTVGCAGGAIISSSLPIERENAEGIYVRIAIKGLLGGHSGDMINKGRGNANKILGRLLFELNKKTAYRLISINGGTKDNAIPLESQAELLINSGNYEKALEFRTEFERTLKDEFALSDGGVSVVINRGVNESRSAMTQKSASDAIALLLNLPFGVIKMMCELPDHVETSSNVGIISTDEKTFKTTSLVRSSKTTERDAVVDEIISLTGVLCGTTKVGGVYPPWQYSEDSPLLTHMVSVYRKMYGKAPKIDVMHGGLECGYFYENIPGLSAVSIGPAIKDIHTVNERLSISSALRVYDYILNVLKAF